MPLLIRRTRASLAFAAALLLTGCDRGTSPSPNLLSMAVTTTLPDLTGFDALVNIGFDRAQITILTANDGAVVDTIVPFPPDSDALQMAIRLPLSGASDSVLVQVTLLATTLPLFFGQQAALVKLGPPPGTFVQVPLAYVGPGSQVATVTLAPADTVITFLDSVFMSADGRDASGTPVPQFYVSWTTTDPTLAVVNGAGLLRAPATRAMVGIQARTPNGITGSTTVTFSPPPVSMTPVAGDGQTDGVGVVLLQPLVVEVRAADGLGVKGVAVQFRALDPQSAVIDPVVLTDDAGLAQSFVMLGNVPGRYDYEASAPGLGTIVFSATAF